MIRGSDGIVRDAFDVYFICVVFSMLIGLLSWAFWVISIVPHPPGPTSGVVVVNALDALSQVALLSLGLSLIPTLAVAIYWKVAEK